VLRESAEPAQQRVVDVCHRVILCAPLERLRGRLSVTRGSGSRLNLARQRWLRLRDPGYLIVHWTTPLRPDASVKVCVHPRGVKGCQSVRFRQSFTLMPSDCRSVGVTLTSPSDIAV
jgi:hypothetical protein